MAKFPADHPVWTIVQHSVYLTALILVLWINASNFDGTEIKTILQMGGAALGYKVVENKIKGKEGPDA